MFASLIIVLFSGIPVIFGISGAAILWVIVFAGPQYLYSIPLQLISITNNEILLAMPMFILMGNFIAYSGIGDELFGTIHMFFGPLRGGLAMGTVVICAIFAACSGLISVAILTMGLIALPSMLSRHYDKHIALGTLAAGGALGTLIPPSVPMIIYASLTQVSVGKLFSGGVVPGVMLAGFYIVYIGIRSFFNSKLCPSIPKEETPSWIEKLKAIRALTAPLVLIVLVLGSIWSGVATPTEAGSVGAFGALLVTVLKRRFTWSMLRDAVWRSALLTSFGVFILLAAGAFNTVYMTTGASNLIKRIMIGLPVQPEMVIIIFMGIIFFCGMIMDEWAMLILLTPLFVPTVIALGFDPLWFGVLFIVNIQMAYLTPPYGFALFLIKSILPKGLDMSDLYRAIVPFVILQFIGLILCFIFPKIILWLPNLLIK
jgi:tripartite ATP-independent transporter DctM subunit